FNIPLNIRGTSSHLTRLCAHLWHNLADKIVLLAHSESCHCHFICLRLIHSPKQSSSLLRIHIRQNRASRCRVLYSKHRVSSDVLQRVCNRIESSRNCSCVLTGCRQLLLYNSQSGR